jgi:hypothetical protein
LQDPVNQDPAISGSQQLRIARNHRRFGDDPAGKQQGDSCSAWFDSAWFDSARFDHGVPGIAHPGRSAVDPGASIPWLAESATRLSLQPHERRTITVTMDASTSQSTQPGSYTAELVFGSSTPYPISPVAVALTVTAPKG